jgi:hypothetical protein
MNSRRVRIEKVEEVRYIGDRGNLQALSEARTELDSKNSGTNIGLVVGILAGMLVLVIALFLAKGKHRRKQQRQEAFVEEDDGNLPNSVASATIAKSDQAVANDEINMADSEDTIETPPDSNSEEVSDEKQTIDPVNVKTTTVLTSTFEPPAEEPHKSKQAVENQAVVKAHSIPPRPPLSVVPVDESLTKKEKKQEKSKTLATRRKRKKKKKPKQRVLKRVSSKNSINEMETIREDEEDGEEEEGSEEFEYEGSEYSTDDEDEVVVDEPTTQNNDSPGQPKPPSPIQEEPKIKRLPPPWI